MLIYIVSFIVNMFYGRLLLGNDPSIASEKSKKIYLFFSTLQLGLICGFRSLSVGWDTPTYYDEWVYSLPGSIAELLSYSGRFEYGFVLYVFLIKILGGGFQSFLIVSSLYIMSCACVFVYRHSKNVLLSMFILLCFPYYYSSFDIIRHFLAVSFILLGYKYAILHQPLRFIPFVVAAFLFQKTDIVLGLFYFLPRLKFNLRFVSITLIVTIFILLSQSMLPTSGLAAIFNYDLDLFDGWFNADAGGIKTALMYFAVLIVTFLAHRNNQECISTQGSVVIMCVIFALSVIFTRNRMAIRLIMASIAFMSICLPDVFSYSNSVDINKNRIWLISFVLIGLLYHCYMLISSWQKVVPYMPYWV